MKRSSGAETQGVVEKHDAARNLYKVRMGAEGSKIVQPAGLRLAPASAPASNPWGSSPSQPPSAAAAQPPAARPAVAAPLPLAAQPSPPAAAAASERAAAEQARAEKARAEQQAKARADAEAKAVAQRAAAEKAAADRAAADKMAADRARADRAAKAEAEAREAADKAAAAKAAQAQAEAAAAADATASSARAVAAANAQAASEAKAASLAEHTRLVEDAEAAVARVGAERLSQKRQEDADEAARYKASRERAAADMEAIEKRAAMEKQSRAEEEARREAEWIAAKERTRVAAAEAAERKAARERVEADERAARDVAERAEASARLQAAQARAAERLSTSSRDEPRYANSSPMRNGVHGGVSTPGSIFSPTPAKPVREPPAPVGSWAGSAHGRGQDRGYDEVPMATPGAPLVDERLPSPMIAPLHHPSIHGHSQSLHADSLLGRAPHGELRFEGMRIFGVTPPPALAPSPALYDSRAGAKLVDHVAGSDDLRSTLPPAANGMRIIGTTASPEVAEHRHRSAYGEAGSYAPDAAYGGYSEPTRDRHNPQFQHPHSQALLRSVNGSIAHRSHEYPLWDAPPPPSLPPHLRRHSSPHSYALTAWGPSRGHYEERDVGGRYDDFDSLERRPPPPRLPVYHSTRAGSDPRRGPLTPPPPPPQRRRMAAGGVSMYEEWINEQRVADGVAPYLPPRRPPPRSPFERALAACLGMGWATG